MQWNKNTIFFYSLRYVFPLKMRDICSLAMTYTISSLESLEQLMDS